MRRILFVVFILMSQLVIAVPPVAFDLSDSVLDTGQPPTEVVMQDLSHNAKYGAVRNERIFMGFYHNTDIVGLPVSPVDGYEYNQDEVQYGWQLYSSRAPDSGFVAGQKTPPRLYGGQAAIPYFFINDIEDSSGYVTTIGHYYKVDSAEIPSFDGILKVYAICQRSDVSENGGLPTTPTANYYALPTPTQWDLSANLAGDLRLSFDIPPGADYLKGYLNLLVDDELYRVSTYLTADLGETDVTMQVNSVSELIVGKNYGVGTEIIRIDGPGIQGVAPTSTTVEIARSLFNTVAAAVSSATAQTNGVYMLTEKTLTFDFVPGFTLSHPTSNPANTNEYFVIRLKPGRLRILYASLQFSNDAGVSEPSGQGFDLYAFEPSTAYGTLPGLRTSVGGLLTLKVDGPLEVGLDLGENLVFPDRVTLGPTFAVVPIGDEPIGADLTFRINTIDADGVVTYGGVATIKAGETGTGTFSTGAAGGIMNGLQWQVEILTVGSTYPGRDLTVYAYY